MIDPRLPWFAMGATTTFALQWLMQIERRRLRHLSRQAYRELLARHRGSNPPPPGAKPPVPNGPPPVYGSYEFFNRAYLEFIGQRLLGSAPPPAVKRPSDPTLPDIPARPRPAGGRLIRNDRDPGKRGLQAWAGFTTPRPDTTPRPHPGSGRIIDSNGDTIGYVPISGGKNPNPPPSEP